MGAAKSLQETGALAANASEHPPFLKNHGPRNEGEKEKDCKNDAGDQSGLLKNSHNVGRKDRIEKKNGAPLSEREVFSGRKNRNTRTNTRNQYDAQVFDGAAYWE